MGADLGYYRPLIVDPSNTFVFASPILLFSDAIRALVTTRLQGYNRSVAMIPIQICGGDSMTGLTFTRPGR